MEVQWRYQGRRRKEADRSGRACPGLWACGTSKRAVPGSVRAALGPGAEPVCQMVLTELRGQLSNRLVAEAVHGLASTLTQSRPRGEPSVSAPRRAHNLSQRLDANEVAQIVASYRSGVHSVELASRHGLSSHSVLVVLDQQNLRRRRRPIERELGDAIELYESGLSVSDVGERMHRVPSTLFLTFKRAGYLLRRPGRRART